MPVDDAFEDVAPCLQQGYVLIVRDGCCDDLRLQPVHYCQTSQPAVCHNTIYTLQLHYRCVTGALQVVRDGSCDDVRLQPVHYCQTSQAAVYQSTTATAKVYYTCMHYTLQPLILCSLHPAMAKHQQQSPVSLNTKQHHSLIFVRT